MTCLRKGFEELNRSNYLGLVSRTRREPARGGLLMAMLDDELLGGIVVLRGPCLHYVYIATTERPDFRKLPIAYLLQWRAIEWASQIGLGMYDFGDYTLEKDSSVASFKRGFGGVPGQIAPRYRRILRPWLFTLGIRLRRLKERRTSVGRL